MRRDFLPFLSDPETGEPLRLMAHVEEDGDVHEGELHSESRMYPIVRGIPRFAGYEGQTYADSFGYQWNRWKRTQFDSENVSGPMAGYTARMWERITSQGGSLDSQVVADFGCGSGRFLEIVTSKGGLGIGLDMSSAVEAAAGNFAGNPRVLICQADVLRPPLRPGKLDGAFSIGVLHHTNAPGAGVSAMARCVKPGGWVAACVYPRGSYYDHPLTRAYRAMFRVLQPVAGVRPAMAYAYIAAHVLNPMSRVPGLGIFVKASFPFVRLPDARWSFLDTFDSVTPTYQSTHETFEVFDWFRRSGLVRIQPGDWGSAAFHGRVRRSEDEC